jgi:hypothetical protein
MKKLLIISIALFTFSFANAQEQASLNTIIFPVAELGDCSSAAECKTYCDKLENAAACTEYGEEHGLISAEDAANGLKLKNIKAGPGGCNTKENCRTYCSDATHAEECAQFAEKHKLLNSDQVLKFRKFHAALTANNKPVDCHDQHTCETFCQMRSNNERCLKFAKDNELIEDEKAEEISKFQRAINAGETPGDCDSKETCRTYCSQEANQAECLAFAEKFGWIKSADAEKLRKEGFKGPGGCTTKESCETFCNNTANQDTCLEFAKRLRVLNEKQVDEIRNATNAVRAANTNMPEALQTCLRTALGEELFNKMKAGQFSPDDQSAIAIKSCMIKFAEARSTAVPLDPTTCMVNIEGVMVNKCQGEDINNPPALPTPCIVNVEGVMVNRCTKESTTTSPTTQQCIVTIEGVTVNKCNTEVFPTRPPELTYVQRDCFIKVYGNDTAQKIISGALPITSEMKTKISACIANNIESNWSAPLAE